MNISNSLGFFSQGLNSSSSTSGNLQLDLIQNTFGSQTSVSFDPGRSSAIQATYTSLSIKKATLSKTAVGVIDGVNLVDAAREAVNKQVKIVEGLKELVEKFQNDDLSASEREQVVEDIDILKDGLDLNVEENTYQGLRLLGNDITEAFVPLKDQRYRKVSIPLMEATSSSLGLSSLSVASEESTQEAVSLLEQASLKLDGGMRQLTQSSDRLRSVADDLAKELSRILSVQNVLGQSQALQSAGSLDPGSLTQAQSHRQLMLSNVSSFLA